MNIDKEPVAIRWPAQRGGKWNFADVNDTVPASVIPVAEKLYTSTSAEVSEPDWRKIVENVLYYYKSGAYDAKTAMYKLQRSLEDADAIKALGCV